MIFARFWHYTELSEKIKALQRLTDERKESNARALELAESLLKEKLIEMNGIKKEVLEQAKEAAGRRGEHKWTDAIISILISAIVGGMMAYLVSK